MDRAKLKSDLVRDEGLRLKPYKDSVGKLTIGVGRNLDDVGISEQEASILLDSDILSAENSLDNTLPWWRDLDEPRQRVIANMAFNLGIGRLLGFRKFLTALERGDYLLAGKEMLDSKWSRQVGNRATRLARIMVES